MATKKPRHIDKTVAANIGTLKKVILGHKLKNDTIKIPNTKPKTIPLYF